MKKPIWSKKEEISMIKDIRNKKTFEEISAKYDRSVSAVELRLQKIIHENFTAGRSHDELSNIIGLPLDKIKQYYYEYQGFLDKKSKKKNKPLDGGGNTLLQNDTESIVQKKNDSSSQSTFYALPIFSDNDGISVHNIYNEEPTHNNNNNVCVENLDKKNSIYGKIEGENKFMRMILDNIELKMKIKHYIDKNILDDDIVELLKKTEFSNV